MKAVRRARGADHERSLAFYLHRHIAGARAGRSLERIHASDVTKPDWCPRRHALMVHTNTEPPPEFLGTSLNLAFEMSSSMARLITRWAGEAGIARGDWACQRCRYLHDYGPRPKLCANCNHENFWYQEHRFVSQVSGISGGIDLCVSLPSFKKHRVVELKALAKDGFQKTKKPLKEHTERTNLYLRLIDESTDSARDMIDTQSAIILYVAKGGFGVKTNTHEWGLRDMPWSPFKEFVVKRDDTVTEGITEKARPLRQWMQDPTKTMLPDPICKSKIDSIAQVCPMAKACFK